MKYFWMNHGRWLTGIFGPIAVGTVLSATGVVGSWAIIAGIGLGACLGGLMMAKKI